MILGILLGTSTILLSNYFVFHRRSTTKAEAPQGFDTISLEYRLPDEDCKLLKQAFLPGSEFQWMVGMSSENKHDKEVMQKHWDVTSYLVECVVRYAEDYGYILVQRDDKGTYEGSLCLVPPYASWWLRKAQFMRSVVPLGRPVPDKIGGLVGKRFHEFIESTERSHFNVMKTADHWYVPNLGVAETAQGRGVGRRLIQAALAFIEEQGPVRPVYLECNDENVAFYEKVGFSCEQRYLMQEEPTAEEKTYSFNSMVHRIDDGVMQ